MCNSELREKMRSRGVRQWQVANYLGISEATMGRKMRCELTADFREKVIEAIEVLGSTKSDTVNKQEV